MQNQFNIIWVIAVRSGGLVANNPPLLYDNILSLTLALSTIAALSAVLV